MKSAFLIFFCAVFNSICSLAQTPEKIKVKKEVQDIYFFQKGKSTDTISANTGNIFYLSVNKEKACSIKIDIENGQLIQLDDTTFQLKHMVRLNYLHVFEDKLVKAEKKQGQLPKPEKNVLEKCSVYKAMINGYNISVDPNVITIRFTNTDNDKLVLSNKFYYR